MNDEEREMYEFAKDLTHSAGSKLRLERQHSVITVREKTSQMDLVTEHDLLIEKLLVKAILGKYPGHGIWNNAGEGFLSAEKTIMDHPVVSYW
ncbi:inositol monophosphatase family protein [Desulfosporosinus sp. BG]|uniref:inositol monophosphatase family protein n=1 Tax=Desulfosporosinus sp. BG TaxID=1633135 RepID=UPI00083A32A0|nr:inositol monophosphatase family protein [Desulfosporosinus sp. BG]ODA42404.1 hypothetical protein DSBG_0791 [Desulfosporosinus sp. BG]